MEARQARRRTAVSPPAYLSKELESPEKKKSNMKHRFNRLFPEGLLRPFWWIYPVLIVIGIFAARLSSSSSVTTTIMDTVPPPPPFTNTTKVIDPFEKLSKGPKTLAVLYPPGLFGGYRNQVIRFVAFCVYAMQNGYQQIMLPSLVWSTTRDGKEHDWFPVPHDMLFDVELWNSILGEDLPKLKKYRSRYHDDWKVPHGDVEHKDPLIAEVLSRGFMRSIYNYSVSVASREIIVNPRKIDLLPNVSTCENPAAYGGGSSAGRLWWDYHVLTDKRKYEEFPFDADVKILKALQPKKEFRDLAMQCVVDGSGGAVKQQDKKTTIGSVPYVALHARVELEMLGHKCGRNMEKNLTKIFEMVNGLVDDLPHDVQGVFVAVSRSGIEVKKGKIYNSLQDYADDNLDTMNRVVGTRTTPGSGLRKGALSVFECGRPAVQRYYDSHPDEPNFGSILESMVNFYVATEATAFVGVRGSSYSTDIWTTRYHNGKGKANYEYTPDGIKLIENGGLPPPHKSC